MLGLIILVGLGLLVLWFVRRSGGTQAALRRLRQRDWQSVSGTEAKLRHLVGQSTADRLIERAALNNPGKPRSWCAEKALYDYQRDRR